jgi:predicted GNAT superfamily acetyltransferase
MKVVRATLKFLPAISALAEKVAFSTLSENQRSAGFLLPYSEIEYRTFINFAEHFYVLADSKTLAGFVLAHTSEKIGLFGWEEIYDYISRMKSGPFIVVRQICVDPDYSTKGYGRKLYEELFEHTQNEKALHPVAVGFIWQRPCNLASEKFHRALGWKKIDTYALKNGEGVVGIWERKI